MQNCIITAETTCDLSPDILQDRGFRTIPITIIMGLEEKKDGVAIKAEELFDYVKKTGQLPKTAAVSVEEYKEFFTEVKKDCEKIIHFSISSKASTSFNNALAAAKEIDGVYVVDTKALSTGEALLMLKASDMLQEGVAVEEVYNKIVELTGKVQTSFVVDTLDYLAKGGRCSAVALIASKILKIHPYIYENDGALQVKKKYMGTLQRALSSYVQDVATEYKNYDKRRVFVTHSPCDGRELVEEVIAKVKEYFDFEEIIETQAGATVSTHCGKNTIGVLFIAE
ncbi:MAG: DegV family protein [Clostridia bacterium]|nr:DegV family protein [Clostridia bacterium]